MSDPLTDAEMAEGLRLCSMGYPRPVVPMADLLPRALAELQEARRVLAEFAELRATVGKYIVTVDGKVVLEGGDIYTQINGGVSMFRVVRIDGSKLFCTDEDSDWVFDVSDAYSTREIARAADDGERGSK